MPNRDGSLTVKDIAFCKNYVVSGNIVASRMDSHKCSYKVAGVEGSKALKDPRIAAYIDELRAINDADMRIQTEKLKQETLEAARACLTLGKLILDICISKGKEGRNPDGTYKLSSQAINALARGGDTATRIIKTSHENLITYSGLEAIAEMIIKENYDQN